MQPYKHLGYQCDDSCLQYKVKKVCAHTMAAAHDNNKLEEHIKSLLKASPKRRLDTLCTGKPEAGKKKSNKQKRKKGGDHLHSLQKSQLVLQSIHGVSPVTPLSSQENKSAACESAQAVTKNLTKDHHKWTS